MTSASSAASLGIARLANGALVLLAAATIAGAWGFELIGGYAPCHLCLMQRDPYYAAIPLAILAFLSLVYRRGRAAAAALVGTAAIFAYGGALGVYQAGAEWKFWQGPTDCGVTRGGDMPLNANDMLSTLNAVRIPSCTDALWHFLGLSFAGWNVVMSAALVVLALIAARAAWRVSPTSA